MNPCIHHWLLDAQSKGRCLKCGASKRFLTPMEVGALLDRPRTHTIYPSAASWQYREYLAAAESAIRAPGLYRP